MTVGSTNRSSALKALVCAPDVAQGLALLGQRAFLLLEIPVFLGLPTLLRVPTLGAGDAALRADCSAIAAIWSDVIGRGGQGLCFPAAMGCRGRSLLSTCQRTSPRVTSRRLSKSHQESYREMRAGADPRLHMYRRMSEEPTYPLRMRTHALAPFGSRQD